MTQTIEQLTARVRELEEENARLNGVIESNIDDGIDKIMAMSDEQVSALAGFEGSNPEDKATIARQCMDIAMLRVDLAASQAYAEQLRVALEKSRSVFHQYVRIHLDKNPPDGEKAARNAFHREICDKALATQTDTSALDAYVAEKVKETADEHRKATLLRFEQTQELTRQRDLAVEALENLARLGNGDRYGNSVGNTIAQQALSTIKGSEK